MSKDKLLAELKSLSETYKKAENEKEHTLSTLSRLQGEFEVASTRMRRIKSAQAGIKQGVRTTGAYILGRRNRKKLFSRSYRMKDAQNKLKQYTYHLYELGFTKHALEELEACYTTSKDWNLRRAAAWELALWYANKYDVDGAREAFKYLPTAVKGVKEAAFLRRSAIIGAECADRAGQKGSALNLLGTVMEQRHPDIFLARANLAIDLAERTEWINLALAHYNLTPVAFREDTYDSLTSEKALEISDGPKVTVIMPAYNAARGISTGIESILNQTWANIELIVVDDQSTDETVSIVSQHAAADTRIKLMTTPKNSGPYVARNIALGAATGMFVTVNDADDWSHPEKIEIQVRHLLNNEKVIANTSAHARLTESLKLHRRGTPGTYIFSNMSSLMFRRQPVLDQIGYWDQVRFAGDSEYKRRMEAVFGTAAIVDLDSGPLSFPRQAQGSLTSSSAYGYKGFLMGVRKEYAETYRAFHRQVDITDLYYPFEPSIRPYPVPAPMRIKKEHNNLGYRAFDIVIVADFRMASNFHKSTLKEIARNQERNLRTGLVQMAHYDFDISKSINEDIRNIIDGNSVEMLVYGESVETQVLLIKHPLVFEFEQVYTPDIRARIVRGVIEQPPEQLRQLSRYAAKYAGKEVIWHPLNDSVRKTINPTGIRLSAENWMGYERKLDDWIL
ncbi:glycosyltransferase family 2 protein [Salinicoccus sesuvii]|uniref:Glycosyltransferase family 2 protein n=1 Tax=Salinicoccus sesuvii TaxID=868281 RepID=A0ABV7N8D9_9STAP